MKPIIFLIVSILSCCADATAFSKVMIVGGYTGFFYFPDEVEVIDLLSSETTCQMAEDFPVKSLLAKGGLGFQDKPLVCIGSFPSTSCHLYEDGTWKISNSLNQPRVGFAFSKSPFPDGKLFVTGGFNPEDGTVFSSTEMLTENGWQMSVPLPVQIATHCMVTINSTSVMIIGGLNNEDFTGITFLFNSEINIWKEGPKLKTPRMYPNCGLIRKNSQSDEKSLIVVGGLDGKEAPLSSVEVLDLDTDSWRSGPDLPFAFAGSAMVEDPSGGVVLIGGGYRDDGGALALDTLYQLAHGGPGVTWELMSQKLQIPRYAFASFLIPDEISACT